MFEPLPLESRDGKTVLLPVSRIISYAETRPGITEIAYYFNTARAPSHAYVTLPETAIDVLMRTHGLEGEIRLVTPEFYGRANLNIRGKQVRVNFANVGPIEGYNDAPTVTLASPLHTVLHSIDALAQSLDTPDPFASVPVTAKFVQAPTRRGGHELGYVLKAVPPLRAGPFPR